MLTILLTVGLPRERVNARFVHSDSNSSFMLWPTLPQYILGMQTIGASCTVTIEKKLHPGFTYSSTYVFASRLSKLITAAVQECYCSWLYRTSWITRSTIIPPGRYEEVVKQEIIKAFTQHVFVRSALESRLVWSACATSTAVAIFRTRQPFQSECPTWSVPQDWKETGPYWWLIFFRALRSRRFAETKYLLKNMDLQGKRLLQCSWLNNLRWNWMRCTKPQKKIRILTEGYSQ